jgi:hypothetical protein
MAAFSDIRIVGIGGSPPAQVTPANQLLAAETSPARIRRFTANVDPSTGCKSFDAPAPHSFMLKQAVIDVYVSRSDAIDNITVYASKNCSAPIGSVNPTDYGTTTIPFEPGVPIRSGGGFSVRAGPNEARAHVYLLGYTMPANAVP